MTYECINHKLITIKNNFYIYVYVHYNVILIILCYIVMRSCYLIELQSNEFV